MKHKPVYIVDAKRTAIGSFGGMFRDVGAPVLFAAAAEKLSQFNEVKSHIGEVIIGNVLQAGIGQNPARIASTLSGVPHSSPAITVNIVCGSGLKSIMLGSQAIQLGQSDLVLAGGMESMSRAPYYLLQQRFGNKLGDLTARDGIILDGLYCALTDQHMGCTAENIAQKYSISRVDQDEYALLSQQRAARAIDSGEFKDEIAPVTVTTKKGTIELATDEQPRRDSSFEGLSKLKPVFNKSGSVTAGNSSTLNDGASAVMLASEEGLKTFNLRPKAEIISYQTVGLDPSYMGLGAYLAAEQCLKKSKISPSDITIWEINEAFAVQSLAVLKELDLDPAQVNKVGGAIALGHPLGASGARLLTTLLHQLVHHDKKTGLVSLCVGGGQGVGMIIKTI